MKANKDSVPISLGGRTHDYIVIILYQVTHVTLVPTTLFIAHIMSRVLQNAGCAAQYAINHTKTQHGAAARTFYQY